MQEPAISVIIPMYNTEAYIRECVDSVLAQTFQDFEIIIVDDCSADGSLALCRELYGENAKVTILQREKNGTVGAARNTGIRAARGKYIAFLDSDDLYMPNALACLYRAAEKYRADVVHSPGCYLPNGDMEHITVQDDFRTMICDQLPLPREPERLSGDMETRVCLWAERKLCTAVWGKLFRRDFLLRHQLWFEEDIVPGQDGIFLFRCVLWAGNFIRLPEILYIYRRPRTSITHSPRNAAFLAQAVGAMLRKLSSLEAYMGKMESFALHPDWQEKVRQFVILDTDPFFVQECYLADGRVAGDMSPVHQVFRDYFGSNAWFVEYFFHAYHRANVNNAPLRGVQMSYVFPWHLFREGSRIVIYGAGEVGKCFYEQAARFHYVELAGIVDRNADKIHTLGVPAGKVEALYGMDFDYLLISVINRNVAQDIRRELMGMGVPGKKILWDGENYAIDDYYRRVCFPMLRSRQLIIYGAGLNAQEYYRYLERQGRSGEVLCFAVTQKEGQGDTLCGLPLLSIAKAAQDYPLARIHVVLQEKYHGEVRETLRGMGRQAEKCIGLRDMTMLLGAEALEELSAALPEFAVLRKPKDYSMLYLFPQKEPRKIYEFYPMTQVPLSETDMQNLKHTVKQGHEEFFGPYPREFAFREKTVKEPSLFLAMASSGKDAPVSLEKSPPAYLHRVCAGAACSFESRGQGAFYDDTGENISGKNSFYSELTVTYWLWKNPQNAAYLGLCHYRRHFLLGEELLGAMAEGAVDIIVPRPRLTFPSVRQYFSELPVTSMTAEDYDKMLACLGEQDGKDRELAERIFAGNIHYPNNMLIAKGELFGKYCQWLFGILEDIEKRHSNSGTEPVPRCMGYVGELLTTLFIAKIHRKYQIAYADYELLG